MTQKFLRVSFVSAITLFFLTGCVPQKSTVSNPSIAGGVFVESPENPLAKSTVAIARPENIPFGKTMCSGVLIQKNVVLTAAHCFLTASASDVRVVFATRVANVQQEFTRQAKQLFIHPEFFADAALGHTYGASNDIALLTLEGEAPPTHASVSIFTEAQLPGELQLAGYGLQDEKNLTSSGFLKTVAARVVEVDSYRKMLTVEAGVNAGITTGALRGDSGGPAYVSENGTLRVAGVLSTGTVGATGSFNGKNIYTLATPYAPWIQSTLDLVNSGKTIQDPVQGIQYLVSKHDPSTFAITVENTNSVAHICNIKISASVVFVNMERTEKLKLKKVPSEKAEADSITVSLAARDPSPTAEKKSYTTVYAERTQATRPYKDFVVRAQCDSAPASAPVSAVLTTELQKELL